MGETVKEESKSEEAPKEEDRPAQERKEHKVVEGERVQEKTAEAPGMEDNRAKEAKAREEKPAEAQKVTKSWFSFGKKKSKEDKPKEASTKKQPFEDPKQMEEKPAASPALEGTGSETHKAESKSAGVSKQEDRPAREPKPMEQKVA